MLSNVLVLIRVVVGKFFNHDLRKQSSVKACMRNSYICFCTSMESVISGMCVDQIGYRIRQLIPIATYRSNKTIATATIRFIVTVAILV